MVCCFKLALLPNCALCTVAALLEVFTVPASAVRQESVHDSQHQQHAEPATALNGMHLLFAACS